jgi:hypothetical protein
MRFAMRMPKRNTGILHVLSSGHPARTRVQAGSLFDESGRMPELRR